MKYYIVVNGRLRYKDPLTKRKADLKVQYLQGQGETNIELVEVEGKENKFNAKKTQVNGKWFDSRSEARCYESLLLRQKAGEIASIGLQPAYKVIDGYVHPVTGKKIRAAYYFADFFITYADGRTEVVDVKSEATRTAVYLLKKKLFESQYGIPVVEWDSKNF